MSSSLLVRLGLRQSGPWEPPTLLDRLLASPIRAAAHYLYAWIVGVRGWATRRHFLDAAEARATPTIRVVCISDTHDQIVPDIPDGDLLIHAGDLTDHGRPADLQAQLDWLASLPHPHKVVVCGNHDSWFDPAARVAKGMAADAPGPRFADDMHYLQHEARTLQFANGRSLKVYGAADIPRCGPDSFSYQYDRSTPPWQGLIPSDVDILITHPPPRHHLDLGLGCAGLLAEVWRVRPPLHVFGHVHWGAGRQLVFWDETQRAYEVLTEDGREFGQPFREESLGSRLGYLGRLVAAATMATVLLPVWLFAPDILAAEGRGASSILVNAGQMYGNSGRLGNSVQVVDM
ncbi:hypothetical protein HMPREF1624_04117 [Sporothrix schenckii ATCC 58251]|uniref:Calcineurin-like phosphoesterase domain-containing protein n=1 Tax=Sporothrix schenckii (strain ATCC 58251 / de Perez 2211183) TaxID=1391915 RepID=U7PW33_SPOS1|nr:hypothetical protein HMPREF1624_04117 [Sporothrix schenckii ATCC 58251]